MGSYGAKFIIKDSKDNVLCDRIKERPDVCFSEGWPYMKDLNRIEVHILDNPQTKENIKKYIDILSVLFGKLDYNEELNTVSFNAVNRIHGILCCQVIRYIWEHGFDNFHRIVPLVIRLLDEYDLEESEALALAHYALDGFFNANHSLYDHDGVTLFTNEEFKALLYNSTFKYVGDCSRLLNDPDHASRVKIKTKEANIDNVIAELKIEKRKK